MCCRALSPRGLWDAGVSIPPRTSSPGGRQPPGPCLPHTHSAATATPRRRRPSPHDARNATAPWVSWGCAGRERRWRRAGHVRGGSSAPAVCRAPAGFRTAADKCRCAHTQLGNPTAADKSQCLRTARWPSGRVLWQWHVDGRGKATPGARSQQMSVGFPGSRTAAGTAAPLGSWQALPLVS